MTATDGDLIQWYIEAKRKNHQTAMHWIIKQAEERDIRPALNAAWELAK